MKKPIEDEFTNLPISRQRKYQLRKARDGRCTQCGEPVVGGKRCLQHLIEARERQRRMQGLKRRYYGTLSYKLQGDGQEDGRRASWRAEEKRVNGSARQLKQERGLALARSA